RVLDAVPGLVGEFTEIDLPGVVRRTQHVDIGAGAEHPLARAGEDHDLHFGMLEPDPVERIVELDVDAEVVGVQLELVAGLNAGILPDVKREGGDLAGKAQLPVLVARRVGIERDHSGALLGGSAATEALSSTRLWSRVLPAVSTVASALL